ncbi:MAG: lysostaphin resistance A-like protein [Bacteroidota bacterium]
MSDLIERGVPLLSRAGRRKMALLSPIVVTLLGQVASRILGPSIGVWSWVPLVIGYWAVCGLLIVWGGGREQISRWLGPSQGGLFWRLLAIVLSILPSLTLLVPEGWRFFSQVEVWLPTILFVALNPWIEELYWRGLMLDSAGSKTRWLAILYSSTLFMINHMWIGVIAIGARNPMASVFQFAYGVLMSVTYLETHSLRWPIAAHFLTNLLTPTVAVFLNVYVP